MISGMLKNRRKANKMNKDVFICYETTTGLSYAKHLRKALKKWIDRL